MEHLQIILPSVLLLIGFLLKLLVGRKYDMPATIQSVCELPVDIIFLALSFTVAFTITKVDNQSSGLFYCFIGIATAILIVLLWRISVDQFLKKSRWWILLLFINLSIAGFAINKSVSLVIETKNVEISNIDYESNQNNNHE
ncbi:hypothetical protein DHD05_04900 [Arenibacter sp. N53]|uniref:hypothetical protein n=1 Tax=Arenibacter TaxID=178469 RepID=UPI000CD48E6E|nr:MULTISPECIES: hypothetical protein [Arenibacter]MCM4150924.1 hypothetical protein [Arenibacter sp. N53]